MISKTTPPVFVVSTTNTTIFSNHSLQVNNINSDLEKSNQRRSASMKHKPRSHVHKLPEIRGECGYIKTQSSHARSEVQCSAETSNDCLEQFKLKSTQRSALETDPRSGWREREAQTDIVGVSHPVFYPSFEHSLPLMNGKLFSSQLLMLWIIHHQTNQQREQGDESAFWLQY